MLLASLFLVDIGSRGHEGGDFLFLFFINKRCFDLLLMD